MSNTPNRGLFYVPENTRDPAAGLNLALNQIDALLQTTVLSMALTAPPASAEDGDLYIVGEGATDEWSGHDFSLARYVAVGSFWQFFAPGEQVSIVLNLDDGEIYKYLPGSASEWVRQASAGGSVQAHRCSFVSPTELTTATNPVDLYMPVGGIIVGIRVFGVGGPGSCSIAIWKDAEANYPPAVGDSIVGTPIVIAAGSKYADDTLTGWDIDIVAGDVLRFTLSSVSTFTALFITLLVEPN